jgi:hypothetical protein
MIMGRHKKGTAMKKAALLRIILFVFVAVAWISNPIGASSGRIPVHQQNRPAAQQASQTPPAQPAAVDYDDIARFISGLPCTSETLKALQETPEWKDSNAVLEKSWAELDAKRLQPMRAWADAELAEANAATKILFYPFGGPDFLTAFVLFPNAETYVLLGLEFVGKLPDFSNTDPKRVLNYLGNLNAALADFFNKSYFITKNMNVALSSDKVDGVLPVICFFLKRMNNTISGIKRVDFLTKGEIVDVDFAGARRKMQRPYGIKIEFFANGTNKPRTLYYISSNLLDVDFKKDSSLYLYLENLNFETTFIKSASYLMHYKTFSNIRSLILAKSRYILEDDTGIPYKYFPAKDWDEQLYGEYIKPISDFSGVEQLDLKTAYADASKVKKLPFHLGYHWGANKDSILYFKKKEGEPIR